MCSGAAFIVTILSNTLKTCKHVLVGESKLTLLWVAMTLEIRHIAHFIIEGIWGDHSVLVWKYLDIADDIFQNRFQTNCLIFVWYFIIKITTANVDLAQWHCFTKFSKEIAFLYAESRRVGEQSWTLYFLWFSDELI